MKHTSLRVLLAIAAVSSFVGIIVACNSAASGTSSSPGPYCSSLSSCCNAVSGAQATSCLEALSTGSEEQCSAELQTLYTAGACGVTTSSTGATSTTGTTVTTTTVTGTGATTTTFTTSSGQSTGIESSTSGIITSGTGSSFSTGTGSSVFTGTGSSVFTGAQAGDIGDECITPDGGLQCTPGTIQCQDGGACTVPGNFCCQDPANGNSCMAAGGSCANGTHIACDEAADCAQGDICCIQSTGTTASSARVFCHHGTTCPEPTGSIASAQICRSNNECASGACRFWECVGNIIEACANPVPASPSLCTEL